jgi:hypothetical protein
MLEAIVRMNDSYAEESRKIRQGLTAVQAENVFDVLSIG